MAQLVLTSHEQASHFNSCARLPLGINGLRLDMLGGILPDGLDLV
jgi:hypothetical protein